MIRIADTQADCDLMVAAARRMWALNPSNQMQYTNEAKAVQYIEHACLTGRVAIVDETFGIMFDVGAMWYSTERFLIEECLLRLVKNDIPVYTAIAALDELRTAYECVMTVVGDTQVGRMTPHYIAAGYRVLGTQLIKD